MSSWLSRPGRRCWLRSGRRGLIRSIRIFGRESTRMHRTSRIRRGRTAQVRSRRLVMTLQSLKRAIGFTRLVRSRGLTLNILSAMSHILAAFLRTFHSKKVRASGLRTRLRIVRFSRKLALRRAKRFLSMERQAGLDSRLFSGRRMLDCG